MNGRVLIARDPERARTLIDRLTRDGIDAGAFALTRTEVIASADDPTGLKTAGCLAFTSVTAVRIFAGLLRDRGDGATVTRPMVAVGKATAKAVERELGPVLLTSEKGTGASLAEALLASDGWDRDAGVLWPCAETTAGGLAEELEAAGIHVDRWPLYRTAPRPADDIREDVRRFGEVTTLVFAAPSAVHAWTEAFIHPWTAPCVAIGPTTAAALKNAGCGRLKVSEFPTPDSLADAVRRALDEITPTSEMQR